MSEKGTRRDEQKLRRAALLVEEATMDSGDIDISILTDALADDDPHVRASGTWALAEVAYDWPHRTSRATDRLIELLDDDDKWVRRGASWAISEVAEAAPGNASSGIQTLTDHLVDDDQLVQENSTRSVAEIAKQYPNRARPALSVLAKLLENDDTIVQRYAAEAIGNILEGLETIPRGLDQVTVRSLEQYGDLFQKDIEVFDAMEGKSAVETIVDRRFPDDPPAPIGPSSHTEHHRGGPPDSIPRSPQTRVEYEDVERLGGVGAGKTGLVYRTQIATRGDEHVVVAFKRLRSSTYVDDGRAFAADLDTVATEWALLDDHDNVARILGSGRHPDPWIAVEFLDGGSLADRIERVGFHELLWDVLSITRAVSHAHARGVVHGGIRPSNVLFTQTLAGTWDVPKLTDWGVDRCFFDHATTRRWLDPTYAAPEQLATDEFGRPDHATDVYQLGLVVYELFAGRPPFRGTPAEIARKVVERDPRPLESVTEDLPTGLDRIVDRTLAKPKPERYETVDDLLRDLELLVEEHAPSLL